MLQLCSDGHEELCHDGVCPACASTKGLAEVEKDLDVAKDEIQRLEKQVTERDEGIEVLKGAVDSLEQLRDHLRAQLAEAGGNE